MRKNNLKKINTACEPTATNFLQKYQIRKILKNYINIFSVCTKNKIFVEQRFSNFQLYAINLKS